MCWKENQSSCSLFKVKQTLSPQRATSLTFRGIISWTLDSFVLSSMVESFLGPWGPSSPPIPIAMFPFSCLRWLCGAAHFCRSVETITAQTTQQPSCLDTPHSQSLFLHFGSIHHGNYFVWSPPFPGGPWLCPHSATLSLQTDSKVCCPNLHGLIPRFIFPAEGCFSPYMGTRVLPLTLLSVKHTDFSPL